jgi:hypothetical protein
VTSWRRQVVCSMVEGFGRRADIDGDGAWPLEFGQTEQGRDRG